MRLLFDQNLSYNDSTAQVEQALRHRRASIEALSNDPSQVIEIL